MKFKNISFLSFALLCSSFVGALQTPSGEDIPESLLGYFSCTIGNIRCKRLKNTSCLKHSEPCQNSIGSGINDAFNKNGVDIGDISPEKYCKIHKEVCDMILTYEPPITDDDVFNYNKYFTCNDGDLLCKYSKRTSCKEVLSRCYDSYEEEDCDKLSQICDNIVNNNPPDFVSESLKTETYDDITFNHVLSIPSQQLAIVDFISYLDCPIGDFICKNDMSNECREEYEVCNVEPEKLESNLIRNGYQIGELSGKEYCAIFKSVCDRVMSYSRPLTNKDIYDLDSYLECDKNDTICIYRKSSACKEVLKKCYNVYPLEDCNALSDVCNKIYTDTEPSGESVIASLTKTDESEEELQESVDGIVDEYIQHKLIPEIAGSGKNKIRIVVKKINNGKADSREINIDNDQDTNEE